MKTVGDMKEVLNRRGLLTAYLGETDTLGKGIVRITYDSRQVRPGTLFFCKGEGFQTKYLEDAAAAGCVAYVAEEGHVQEGCVLIPCLAVCDIRKAMAVLAAYFF